MLIRLGRSIAQIVPFYRQLAEPQPVPKQKDDSIISKNVLVIFAVVAIIKVSILLLWLI
jgi:hypothetical protein